MLGNTGRDRIQNTKVREILKLDKIQNEIEDSRIRWHGHLKGRILEGYQDKHWNIDQGGKDQEFGQVIEGKNKLRRISRKEELMDENGGRGDIE